jgi:hypothetical protein
MARDDFPKLVIDKLKSRVAHRCSNPNCRVPTAAPTENSEKANCIGIAAHICAASLGGPRYSPSMSTVQRKSFKNGIWLCSNCSIDIDRDVVRYPVDILKEWKEQAEMLARKELGQKLPNNDDAINTVTAALTGLPKSFIATAISNVHQASNSALEVLDSRFMVKSSHNELGTNFGLYAKENVNLSMVIQGDHARECFDKYKRLVAHGEDLEIPTGAISLKGSRLLEEILNMSKDGKFIFKSGRKNGLQKLWVMDRNTSAIESFDDIKGVVSIGSESFDFNGSACGEMFSFSYRKMLSDKEASINFELNFEKWDGCDIRLLPYFEKLNKLFDRLVNGWELFTALEIDGIRVLNSGKGITANDTEFVKETGLTLHYIEKAAKLSSYLQCCVNYSSGFSYTGSEYRELIEAVDILEGKCIYSKNRLISNPTCQLIVDDGASNVKTLLRLEEPASIVIMLDDQKEITLFGQQLTLPKKKMMFTSVLPRITDKVDALSAGDIISVEWIPKDDFEWRIEFEIP